ncbi:speriolin-like protein [Ornithorhynchus anatinus]|uniref:Spermatosis and centriole associated 1 like n=1 Tax=Ornithorhynchus anatinus TaxID=9258 RepID=F6QH73_ORNAN|nr:speriolin-like protein [Ornithorhynchus anatinus]
MGWFRLRKTEDGRGMAEDDDRRRKLMDENANLKKRVKSLEENLMLKQILSESYRENRQRSRELKSPRVSAFPEAYSPGDRVQERGGPSSTPEPSTPFQTSSLEDLLFTQIDISGKEDDPPGCTTPARAALKEFFRPPELELSGMTERKLTQHLSTVPGPPKEKLLPKPKEIIEHKKVCFSESVLVAEDEMRKSYYLNAQHGKVLKMPEIPGSLQRSILDEFPSSSVNTPVEKDASSGCPSAEARNIFKGYLSVPDSFEPRSPERKLSQPLLNSSEDPRAEKPLAEHREMPKLKKVCFSENPLSRGRMKKPQNYYINSIDVQWLSGTEKDRRVVGEIAFQLDRRILAYVFPGVSGLYGFTVSNIPEKIKQISINPLDGSMDEKKRQELTRRFLALTARLEKFGYKRDVHPGFCEFLINTFGVLKDRSNLRSDPLHNNPGALRKMVIDVVPPKFLKDTLMLLSCLCELSKDDSKPLFSW